jgi:hypothetical protein
MTSQYGAYVLRAGLARLQARMRMHTPTLPGTHMHARATMHTHRLIFNTYYFPQQKLCRELASTLRYTWIARLVLTNIRNNTSSFTEHVTQF